MYLEIVTIARVVNEEMGQFSLEIKVFVGPFKSSEQRDLFREHWERQLNSDDHNPNQVKFLSQDELPDGWCAAMTPSQFSGFKRIVWDEGAGEYREM